MKNPIKMFKDWLEENGYSIEPCNCGGPAMGTEHSPDCQMVLSGDELWKWYQADKRDAAIEKGV